MLLRRILIAGLAGALILVFSPTWADDKKAEPPKPAASANADMLAPLPEDRSVSQSITLAGKPLNYQATVGKIPVYNAKGKKIAEVVFTAYTLPGGNPARPVTFAFNGGPGASSVWLNMGAVGPRRVQFGDRGDVPSELKIGDNPDTWLDMTDLVFIDPVGTGYSRSLTDEAESKKEFFNAEADIRYLAHVVYDWLVKNNRLRSPKYLMGESYGGYRAPRLALNLQTHMGVGVSGVVMVSPYLDPAAIGDGTALSPLPWMINLPTMAAGNFERRGTLTADHVAEVERYVRTQFVVDFLAGRADAVAVQRIVKQVAEYTGLDPALVERLDGRVDAATYLREAHRAERKIGSWYDSSLTAFDPFPESFSQRSSDPLINGVLAPATTAMVDFIQREVGWKTDAHYEALSEAVGSAWDRVENLSDKPVSELRQAMATDPKMTVLIAHGWNDLACPFFTSRLVIDQLPRFGGQAKIRLATYAGGHMFYSRPASAAAFKADAKAMYAP